VLKDGFLADFAILDRDITTIPPEDIPSARVVMTVVGGKIVYEPQQGVETK
jgi:predicted amidohydrolase YtcJ